MVAAAGYDIEGAERIWREFGVHTAGTKKKSFVSAAPTSARRFVAMRRTIAEIQAKKKNGAPLVPLAKSKS